MAYAAVISLKNTIRGLKTNPTIYPQIFKSGWKLKALEDSLLRMDDYRNRSIDRSVIDALDAKITEAVCKLQDAFESSVFHYQYHSLPPNSQGLGEEGVEQEINTFLKTVEKLGEEYTRRLDKPLPQEEDDVVLPIHDDLGGSMSTMVGLSDQFEKITNELLDLQPGPITVSVVGMAGNGKTHLATQIYHHPIIVQHFDVMVWVSVGPKPRRMKSLYVDILVQIEPKPKSIYNGEHMDTLQMLLHKSLLGRRCLIVLDDIWSIHVCDYLKAWLPTEGNGRRLLLTTRIEEVVKRHSTILHKIRFLNNEESWNLLWQNVFEEESFPPQLEKAGRKIAENCEGLPLLILAVANILRGLDKTEEYWEKVAEKRTTTFTDACDQISKVLILSYDYLPQHLKACFLYMGVFPQSYEIPASKLINLWTVEDFIESIFPNSLEVNLENIVSNSLVIVCKQSYNYITKSCKLHSAYWHLCVKEARKNKFFHVLIKLNHGSKEYIESQRRFSVQNNILFGIKRVRDSMAAALSTRSLLCTGEDHEYPVEICWNLMLLNVLDALAIRFYEFPAEALKLQLLRYLALTHNGEVPSSISKLQKVKYLILRRHHYIKLLRNSTYLPVEIWYLRSLRYLRIMGNNLPDYPWSGWGDEHGLLTLYMNADSCTTGVFKGIPSLKKLGITIELQPDAAETLNCFEHVVLLRKLESLKCVVMNPRPRSQIVAPPNHLSYLPGSLKKLSLNGLGYSWEYMTAIGSLPKLEVLKLRCSAFQGPEWKTRHEEFQSLEFLVLEDIDLVHWTIDNDKCFPHLQRLIVRHCYKLKLIPRPIGAIPTLEAMEVVDCSPSVVASAMQIHEDRNSLMELCLCSIVYEMKFFHKGYLTDYYC